MAKKVKVRALKDATVNVSGLPNGVIEVNQGDVFKMRGDFLEGMQHKVELIAWEGEDAYFNDEVVEVEQTEEEPQGFDAMSYAEVQARAKELGLSASGKKEDIIARIEAHFEEDEAEEKAITEDVDNKSLASAPENK